MTKTIPLDGNVHKYLKKVQSILYHEYNIEIRLQDILTHIINDKIVGGTHKVAKIVFEGAVNIADAKNINKEEEDITVVHMGD
jgi:hypothetical protein